MSNVKIIFDAYIFYLHFLMFYHRVLFSPCFGPVKTLLEIKGIFEIDIW